MKVEKIFELYDKKQDNEAYKILAKRLKVNKINKSLFKNKLILNVCDPSGRYSKALTMLGAKKVYTYNETKKPLNWMKDLYFKKINLDSKIKSKIKFDFIFCNGVLSHKKNWKIIILNLSDMLKKNGYLWLSLYSYGKHWYEADIVKKNINLKFANSFFRALIYRDWDINKINFLIELFFNDRIYFTKKSIKSFLNKNNFSVVNFLERGISTDLNEIIFQNKKLKKIYGEGEIRLLAQKNN